MSPFAARFALFLAASATLLDAQGSPQNDSADWSAPAAAAYLDARIAWWMTWSTSQRDHDTFCVSCHTAVPYAIARPALHTALQGRSRTQLEWRLLDNVAKRVRMWGVVEPFYPDAKRGVPKTLESRGTESVLNAFILTSYDAREGALTRDARLALDNMWARQITTGVDRGAWPWLQFHNAPWEGDSQFYGTTLAAIAVGTAPGGYSSTLAIQPGLRMLRGYLSRHQASQFLIDRVALVWANAVLPGILTPAERLTIIVAALAKQRPDGGFSLSTFVGGWKRADSTALETRSDGYATGLVAYALQQAGVSRDEPALRRALDWLAKNQVPGEGRWLAWSLNKQRDLSTDIGRFMSDAATAYAILALQYNK